MHLWVLPALVIDVVVDALESYPWNKLTLSLCSILNSFFLFSISFIWSELISDLSQYFPLLVLCHIYLFIQFLSRFCWLSFNVHTALCPTAPSSHLCAPITAQGNLTSVKSSQDLLTAPSIFVQSQHILYIPGRYRTFWIKKLNKKKHWLFLSK